MKYNKGFAPVLILVIVLGVLTVGGVAYFAGKSSAPKNEVNDNSNYFPPVDQNYNPPATYNNNPPQQQTNTQTPPVATTSSITPTISQIVSAGCTKGASCAIKIGEKVSIFGLNFSQNAQVQIDDGYYTYEINTNPNTSGTSSSLSFFMARDINPGRHTLQVVNPVVDKFGNPIIQNYKNFVTGSNLSNIMSFDIQ